MEKAETRVPLVTRAVDIQTRLEAAEASQQTTRYVSDLRERQTQVLTHRTQADALLRAKEAIGSLGADRVRGVSAGAEEAAREIRALERTLRRNPKRIAQDNAYPSRRVGACLAAIEASLLGIWREHVGEVSAYENACVLADGIAEAASAAGELREAVSRLKDAARSLPSAEAQAADVQTLRRKADGLLGALESLVPSGSVKEFLQAMRTGGAVSLQDVLSNEGLLEWLRGHDACSKYEVRPRGSRRDWF